MKKVSIVILGIVSIMFGACNKDTEFENKLRRDIEKMNSLCPIPMASATMVAARYSNDTIFYKYTTEDEFLSTKFNKVLRKQIVLLLTKRDSVFYKPIAEHSIYINYTFKSAKSESSFTITPEVLNEVLNEEMTSKEITDYNLKLIVESENKYKVNLDEGIKSISEFITDENITCMYIIDEDIADIKYLQDNKEELRNSLKDHIKNIIKNKNIDIGFCKLIVNTDRGIRYIVIGNKSDIGFTIDFSSKEISEIVSEQEQLYNFIKEELEKI